MEDVLKNSSVRRIMAEMKRRNIAGEIKILSESARTAAQAAAVLGIQVGQIAASIVFKLPDGNPLLVITSGSHRVNTEMVAEKLGVEKLHRADADFVKSASGISIGGISPFGWLATPTIIIDQSLNDFDVVWAAAGHSHAVFPTSFTELKEQTGAESMVVS